MKTLGEDLRSWESLCLIYPFRHISFTPAERRQAWICFYTNIALQSSISKAFWPVSLGHLAAQRPSFFLSYAKVHPWDVGHWILRIEAWNLRLIETQDCAAGFVQRSECIGIHKVILKLWYPLLYHREESFSCKRPFQQEVVLIPKLCVILTALQAKGQILKTRHVVSREIADKIFILDDCFVQLPRQCGECLCAWG